MLPNSSIIPTLIEQYLAFSETMIQQQTPMTMKDWADIRRLDGQDANA
jgi:hypothetical protein